MVKKAYPTKSKTLVQKKQLVISRHTRLVRFKAWLQIRARRLTLLSGVSIVVLWTLLRHITNGVNYDVVGQIGLAEQWTHGFMSGVQLGATNYLIKIPLYILINALHFLSPINRILLAAIILNLLTYIVLFKLYEKIMNLYVIKDRSWLYLAVGWLATIVGNVFWADYANSRNIETVGGVLFIYLVLKYIKVKNLSTLIAIGITGSFVFFADPIQLYVCGAGACLFIIGRLFFGPTSQKTKDALAIVSVTTVAYLGSLGYLVLAKKFLHVTFLNAPTSRAVYTLSSILNSLHATIISTLKIFGADFFKRPYNFNSLRELLNGLVLCSLLFLVIKLLAVRRNHSASAVAITVIAANYMAYIASGQALQHETSRYLIMVPLVTIIPLLVNSDRLSGKHMRKLQYAWLCVIIMSSVLLAGALATHWPGRHTKDIHIGTLVSFMEEHGYRYAFSSREAGVTTTYFSQEKALVLPMSCSPDHTLSPTNLFYDNAAFQKMNQYHSEMPIILPHDGIKSGVNICKLKDVIAQFGNPKRQMAISGGGVAAVYKASSFRIDTTNSKVIQTVFHKSQRKVLPTPSMPDSRLSMTPNLQTLAGCNHGTLDVVVAHTDDDILFMNPDLQKQLATKCVRSVYVTAGDDGRSGEYWKNRQHGIEAAYASMIKTANIWTGDKTTLNGHTIEVRELRGHPNVGLVFLLLPDGGVKGKGFAVTKYASLEKLTANKNLKIKTVDGSSSYNYAELTKLVAAIISTDKPDTIFSHIGDGPSSIGDHSDHRAVGRLVVQARLTAKSTAQVSSYIGYPINNLPANLPEQAAAQKKAIFYIYAHEDNAICKSPTDCSIETTYGKYFSRSYKLNEFQYHVARNKVKVAGRFSLAEPDFFRSLR